MSYLYLYASQLVISLLAGLFGGLIGSSLYQKSQRRQALKEWDRIADRADNLRPEASNERRIKEN